MQGKILIFWPDRSYGFIAAYDNPTEYFFHTTDFLPDSLPPEKNREVEFDLGKYRGKVKAVHIRVLPRPDEALAGKTPLRPKSYDGGDK